MKYRKVIAILMMVFLTAALTACGGSEPSRSASSETSVSASSSESAAPAESSAETSSEASAAVSDEDLIRQDLEPRLGLVDDAREEIVTQLSADESMKTLFEQTGISVEDFARPLADKINWEITSITVNGEEGTAVVTLTMPDFETLNTTMTERIETWADEQDPSQFETQEDLYKAVGQLVLEIVQDPEVPTYTDTLDVAYKKAGGSWSPVDEAGLKAEFQTIFH